MNRRSILAAAIGLIVFPKPVASDTGSHEPVETRFLTDETKRWLESLYVVAENRVDDSDWVEILARFASVQLNHPLTPEARRRTIARANSKRADKHLFFDQTNGKRVICALIVRMDDKLRI